MPLYRAQTAIAADSVLAQDLTVNTLYFQDTGLGTDPNGLAEDLRAIFETWYGTDRQVETRLYDMGDAPPRPIVGRSIAQSGLAPASSFPREVALCLSYYGERNLPHTRGRIFLGMATAGRSTAGVRPTLAHRTSLLDLATAFAGLGGVDVDWVVYSPTVNSSEGVTTAWVDDEWDTMRSRGLKSTTRSTRAVGS